MRKLLVMVALVMLLSSVLGGAPAVSATSAEVACGLPTVVTLWAGQTIDVGTITVTNDDVNLYVTYQTNGDWYLTEAHLYVLDYEPVGRLAPGKAPYKWEGGPVTSFTFTVPLDNYECGAVLWLQAHAVVVKIVDGEVVQEETAYGGDVVKPRKGSWYANIMYVVECCEDEPSCWEFVDETAWAAGPRYVRQGNWATYTPYVPDSSVVLYAGQYHPAGTVYFSAPVDGMVTITINLTEEWVFNNVEENVKIQDYTLAPTDAPSPGLFDWKYTADGTFFSVTVPQNNFYGVHADVGYWIDLCPGE